MWLGTKAFPQANALMAVEKRLERRLKTAKMKRCIALQRANARNEKPNFNVLHKWLHGIGTFMDDRIVLHKKVVDFIKIDNG